MTDFYKVLELNENATGYAWNARWCRVLSLVPKKDFIFKMKSETKLKNLVTILDTIIEHLISASSTSEIAD